MEGPEDHGEAGGAHDTWPAGLPRGLRAFLTPRTLAVVAIVLVVLWVVASGGFTSVLDKGEARQVDAGQSVEAHPFVLQVREAFWSDDPKPLGFASDDETYLVMRVHADYRRDFWAYSSVLAQAVVVRLGGVQAQPPTVYRAVDGQRASAIQPAMPQEYWLVWTFSSGTPHSAHVPVEYVAQTWRPASLADGYLWTDPKLVAVQTVTAQPQGAVS